MIPELIQEIMEMAYSNLIILSDCNVKYDTSTATRHCGIYILALVRLRGSMMRSRLIVVLHLR